MVLMSFPSGSLFAAMTMSLAFLKFINYWPNFLSVSISFFCLFGVLGVSGPKDPISALYISETPSVIDWHSLDSSTGAAVIDPRFFAFISLNLVPSGSAITSSISRKSIKYSCFFYCSLVSSLISSDFAVVVVRLVKGLNPIVLCVKLEFMAYYFSGHSGASFMNYFPCSVYLVCNRSWKLSLSFEGFSLQL